MPAAGGPARRMTWLGPDVMVRGFTPDGHILFVTTYGQPFFRNYRAYTLDPAGGMPQLLPYGQVNHLAFGPGNARLIGRNTADPARWKRYRGGTAGHFWIDAAGTGTFRRMTRARGQSHQPDVGRRPDLLPVRCRRGRQPLFMPAGRLRCAPAYRPRRLLCAPRADRRGAHRLSMRRRGLAVRSAERSYRAHRHRDAVPLHAGGAQVRGAGRPPRRDRRASGGAQPGGRRARQAVHVRALGRRGPPAWRCRRRPLPACAVAGRRHDAHRRRRRVGRGARRRLRRSGRADAAVGRRPRHRAARGAARLADRARQSPQRGADRRSRSRHDHGDRSQRFGAHRGSRMVGRRRLARVLVLDVHPSLRDQAPRCGQGHERAGDAARVSRLLPGLRSGRPLSLFPVDPHVRSRLRQRAVRVELSAGGAALSDRAVGRRPPAVRSGAARVGPRRRRGQTADGG